MDNHVFYFQDENFNAEKALNGALKMIVGADGISMAALAADNTVLGLEAIQFSNKKYDNQYVESEIKEILSSQKLLAFTFGRVQAAISVPLATLVPQRLFSPQAFDTYFKLLDPAEPDTIYAHDAIDAFGCQLVWGAAPHFKHYLSRYQPQHIGSALIAQFHGLASQEGISIFMNVRGNQAQLFVFDLRNLVFYNTFEFIKPTDLLYFVLLVYDQFRLNPEYVPLQICGAILKGGDCYKILHKYIRIISFLTPGTLPDLPKGDKELPPHYWFDLFSL